MTEVITIASALARARVRLSPSPTASLDAQLLLAHALNSPREYVLAHSERGLSRDQIQAFEDLVERRARHEPVAYLRGTVEWYGFRYSVSPAVLIPRPETELVLEVALSVAGQLGVRHAADIGTGSGVLAAEVAARLPDVRVDAVDISEEALDVARHNLELRGVRERVRLLRGDLVLPLDEPPNMVVANLPYLADAEMDSVAPDLHFEPTTALVGGHSGLELYERLFDQLLERDWAPALVLEIDPRRADALCTLATGVLPQWTLELLRDYAGMDRIAVLLPEGCQ